jgi:hypothetical protein
VIDGERLGTSCPFVPARFREAIKVKDNYLPINSLSVISSVIIITVTATIEHLAILLLD